LAPPVQSRSPGGGARRGSRVPLVPRPPPRPPRPLPPVPPGTLFSFVPGEITAPVDTITDQVTHLLAGLEMPEPTLLGEHLRQTRASPRAALRFLRLGGGGVGVGRRSLPRLFVPRLLPRAPRPVLRAFLPVQTHVLGERLDVHGGHRGDLIHRREGDDVVGAFRPIRAFLALFRFRRRRARGRTRRRRGGGAGGGGGGNGSARRDAERARRRSQGRRWIPRALQQRAPHLRRPRGNSVSAGPAPGIRAAGGEAPPTAGGAAGARPKAAGAGGARRDRAGSAAGAEDVAAPHGWPGAAPQVGGGAPHPGACIGGRGGAPCGEPIIMAGGIPCAGIIRPSGIRYIIWYPGGGAPGGPSGAGGRIAPRVVGVIMLLFVVSREFPRKHGTRGSTEMR
jgi:hypothetical protein